MDHDWRCCPCTSCNNYRQVENDKAKKFIALQKKYKYHYEISANNPPEVNDYLRDVALKMPNPSEFMAHIKVGFRIQPSPAPTRPTARRGQKRTREMKNPTPQSIPYPPTAGSGKNNFVAETMDAETFLLQQMAENSMSRGQPNYILQRFDNNNNDSPTGPNLDPSLYISECLKELASLYSPVKMEQPLLPMTISPNQPLRWVDQFTSVPASPSNRQCQKPADNSQQPTQEPPNLPQWQLEGQTSPQCGNIKTSPQQQSSSSSTTSPNHQSQRSPNQQLPPQPETSSPPQQSQVPSIPTTNSQWQQQPVAAHNRQISPQQSQNNYQTSPTQHATPPQLQNTCRISPNHQIATQNNPQSHIQNHYQSQNGYNEIHHHQHQQQQQQQQQFHIHGNYQMSYMAHHPQHNHYQGFYQQPHQIPNGYQIQYGQPPPLDNYQMLYTQPQLHVNNQQLPYAQSAASLHFFKPPVPDHQLPPFNSLLRQVLTAPLERDGSEQSTISTH